MLFSPFEKDSKSLNRFCVKRTEFCGGSVIIKKRVSAEPNIVPGMTSFSAIKFLINK